MQEKTTYEAGSFQNLFVWDLEWVTLIIPEILKCPYYYV